MRVTPISSRDDVPAAIQNAGTDPEARWYVARVAKSLGVADLIPESWSQAAGAGTDSPVDHAVSIEEEELDAAAKQFADAIEAALRDYAADDETVEDTSAVVASLAARADADDVFDQVLAYVTKRTEAMVAAGVLDQGEAQVLIAAAGKPRRVRSAAGAKRFGQGIGQVITTDPSELAKNPLARLPRKGDVIKVSTTKTGHVNAVRVKSVNVKKQATATTPTQYSYNIEDPTDPGGSSFAGIDMKSVKGAWDQKKFDSSAEGKAYKIYEDLRLDQANNGGSMAKVNAEWDKYQAVRKANKAGTGPDSQKPTPATTKAPAQDAKPGVIPPPANTKNKDIAELKAGDIYVEPETGNKFEVISYSFSGDAARRKASARPTHTLEIKNLQTGKQWSHSATEDELVFEKQSFYVLDSKQATPAATKSLATDAKPVNRFANRTNTTAMTGQHHSYTIKSSSTGDSKYSVEIKNKNNDITYSNSFDSLDAAKTKATAEMTRQDAEVNKSAATKAQEKNADVDTVEDKKNAPTINSISQSVKAATKTPSATSAANLSNQDKVDNAAKMYGAGSAMHKAAQKKFGGYKPGMVNKKPASGMPLPPLNKYSSLDTTAAQLKKYSDADIAAARDEIDTAKTHGGSYSGLDAKSQSQIRKTERMLKTEAARRVGATRSATAATNAVATGSFTSGKDVKYGVINPKLKKGDPGHDTPQVSFGDGTKPVVGNKIIAADGRTGTVVETYQGFTRVQWDTGRAKVMKNGDLNTAAKASKYSNDSDVALKALSIGFQHSLKTNPDNEKLKTSLAEVQAELVRRSGKA